VRQKVRAAKTFPSLWCAVLVFVLVPVPGPFSLRVCVCVCLAAMCVWVFAVFPRLGTRNFSTRALYPFASPRLRHSFALIHPPTQLCTHRSTHSCSPPTKTALVWFWLFVLRTLLHGLLDALGGGSSTLLDSVRFQFPFLSFPFYAFDIWLHYDRYFRIACPATDRQRGESPELQLGELMIVSENKLFRRSINFPMV